MSDISLAHPVWAHAFWLALAFAAVPALVELAGASLPSVGPVGLDGRLLLFVCGVVMLSGILFGLGPAAQTLRFDLRAVLNEGARGSTGARGQKRLRAPVGRSACGRCSRSARSVLRWFC